MLVIGHRGAAAHAPENTIMSFDKAVTFGVDLVELDARLCSSGEIVVIHDATVNRTTNGSGKVADMTLKELKELDAGLGERIPTLSEVLDLFKGRVGINIELKGSGTPEPVWKVLEDRFQKGEWKKGDILVSSFQPDELLDFYGISEGVRIGFIFEDRFDLGMDFASDMGVWSVHARKDLIDKDAVSRARSKGLNVLAWTLNTREEIRKMIDLGINGFFTDRPELYFLEHQG
jgi:glycerophosphoryl diester phosphodiesterase